MRLARKDAAQIRPVTFATSDGWREKPASMIQRVAPFARCPAKKTRRSSTRVNPTHMTAPPRMNPFGSQATTAPMARLSAKTPTCFKKWVYGPSPAAIFI